MDEKSQTTELNTPTFGEAAAYWIKLGFLSFGGPAGPDRDDADRMRRQA